MGFFSTAKRSPEPGSLSIGLLNFYANEEKIKALQIAKDASQNALAQKALQVYKKNQRYETLTKSLNTLVSPTQKDIETWMQTYNVSGAEYKQFKDMIQQKIDKHKFVEQTLPDGSIISLNTETGAEKVIKKAPDKYVNKEDEYNTWQENVRTGQKVNVKSKVAKTDSKIEPWYKNLQTTLRARYFSDTMVPEQDQRDNYDRAMLRAQRKVNEISKSFNISKNKALPIALNTIRKEDAQIKQVTTSLPEVSRSNIVGLGDGTKPETNQIIKKFINLGTPPFIIGKALKDKGWNDTEVINFLQEAIKVKSPTKLNINIQKVKNTVSAKHVKLGGILRINNQLYKYYGNYLQEIPNGEIVRLDNGSK